MSPPSSKRVWQADDTEASHDYTCPMHPEIRQPGPGSCPKCALALEPLVGMAPAMHIEYTCPIARLRRLSRATMHNIWENLLFAFVYNATGVPLVAGILYPAFRLLLSPMRAAAAMTFRTASVIANALRLRKLALR
jgi:hypothetical protein